MDTGPEYSVIVPVFESDASVADLADRLVRVMRAHASSFEIILVDDGSRSPSTWARCKALAEATPEIRALRLMRNYGKPGAVMSGLAHANGCWIVTIDDDGQQRPEDIPKLMALREHDVVVADYARRRTGLASSIGSRLKWHVERVILKLPCRMSPLKLFRREVALGMLEIRAVRPFIPGLMAAVTNDFVSVSVEQQESGHGKSRYNFLKRLRQFSNLVINHSSILLRFVAVAGSLMALLGFSYAGWLVARRVLGAQVEPGWTSLIVVVLVSSGAILMAIGVVGEYLHRLIEIASRGTSYRVRSEAGSSSPARCASNAAIPPMSATSQSATLPSNATTNAGS